MDFARRAGAALVLGASGGLGRAICAALLARGSRVAMTYRSTRPALDESGEGGERPGRVRAYQLELTDPIACRRVVDTAAEECGGVHTLVYAAGPHVAMRHLSTVPAEDFAAQLAGDAAAFFNVVQPALPHLRATQGSVVAVTTAATSRFPRRDGLSAPPKAAIESLVRGIAVEEGRFGVRANCVGPGMLVDGMAERLIASGDLDDRALDVTRANIPLGRFGSAQDIAEAVCFLASDRAGFISGQKLDVDGGYGA